MRMSKNPTSPQRGRANRAARLACLAATLGAGCASHGSFGGSHGRSANFVGSFEVQTPLSAEQSACILAEFLAYEFPNTQADALRPLARAERIDDHHWLLRYERGSAGYLPVANGHFERPSRGERLARSTAADSLLELLPRVRFVETSSVGGRGRPVALATLSVRKAPGGSEVRGHFEGPHAEDRLRRAERLLRGVSTIHLGMQLGRNGQLEEAGAALRRAVTEHRSGFSRVHDPLLAAAHAALGAIELELDDLDAARMSFARSRLLLPADFQLATLEARLSDRLARVEDTSRALHRARSVQPVRAVLSERVPQVARGDEPRTSMAVARAALASGDTMAALAWARRALDFGPSEPEVLLVLADVADASGQPRVADHRRRLAELGGAKPSFGSYGLDPALMLRRALRDTNDVSSLINDPDLHSLLVGLGAERCARVLASEGVDPLLIRTCLTLLQANDDPRLAIIARTRELALPRGTPSTGASASR